MTRTLFLDKIDLDLCYPPFLERVLECKARCRARGALYLTTQLHRSYAESDTLNQIYLRGGPRATPGGYSAHNFGLADDEALIVTEYPKRVCRWNKADFQILGEETLKLGLAWGAGYGDSPHINWPGFTNGFELRPLREIWDNTVGESELARLKKVWQYVDSHTPAIPPFTPSTT